MGRGASGQSCTPLIGASSFRQRRKKVIEELIIKKGKSSQLKIRKMVTHLFLRLENFLIIKNIIFR